MATKRWKDLNRSDLQRLYSKMSGLEIAKEYGIYPNAVYQRLKTLGIECAQQGARRRFNPPKAELEQLYRLMSMAEIASYYDVGETVVFKRLKENGIGGITRSDRLSGKSKSLEHRLNMSRSARESGIRAGNRNGNWKGGRSRKTTAARSRAAYFDWKRAVFARANWKCEACGKEHGEVCDKCGHRSLLHAHHVKPFADNESLRYDPSNGRALCSECHWKEHH